LIVLVDIQTQDPGQARGGFAALSGDASKVIREHGKTVTGKALQERGASKQALAGPMFPWLPIAATAAAGIELEQ
jgi:hypothetical protein